jgi:hypothetical protein
MTTDYDIAGTLSSPPNSIVMNQQHFLDLFDLLYPLSYLFPMKTNPNAGYELFQGAGAIGARASLAVQRLEEGSIILYAPLANKATGTVWFTRATAAAGAVTIKAGTVVATANQRRFITRTDLVFGIGVLGPLSVAIVADLPGYQSNVPGQVVAANGEILPGDISIIWSLVTDPAYGDPSFTVYNVLPTTGGAAGFLEGLGHDRGVEHNSGEAIANYRVRVRSLLDTVSPAAIRRLLNKLFGAGGYKFLEVGQLGLPGMYYDAPGSDYYDSEVYVFTGVLVSGSFLFQEDVVLESTPGSALRARGYMGRLVGGEMTFIVRPGSRPGVGGTYQVRGLRSGAIYAPLSAVIPSSNYNQRYHRLFDAEQFRGYFIVEVPRLGTGDFGFAYDKGVADAYDTGFDDGYPETERQLYFSVYAALDQIRAGGVGFHFEKAPTIVDLDTGPMILACTPSTGSAGTAITNLAGLGFIAGCTVTVDGVSTAATFVSATKLTIASMPAHSPGPATIVVTNPSGQSTGLSGAGIYSYVFTPASLVLSSWQSGPATIDGITTHPNWIGSASAGLSGGRGEAPLPGDPGPYNTLGSSLNGIQSMHYSLNHSDGIGQGSTGTADYVTPTGWSVSILTYIFSTGAPTATPQANGTFMVQYNGNPAWGFGHNTSGVIVWQYDGATFNSAGPFACSTGAWHLIDIVYDGALCKVRIDGGAWSSGALPNAAPFADSFLAGGGSYVTGAIVYDVLERWTSKSILTVADFDNNKAYINAKYGTSF